MKSSGELRRGWSMLAGSTIGMCIGLPIFVGSTSFFIVPMGEELGWSRGLLSMGSAAVFIASLMLPLVGALMDRVGSRPIIAVGAVAFAGCYAALATMPASVPIYIAIMLCVGFLAGPATQNVLFVRPVVQAFDKLRGLAIAVVMNGPVLAGIVILPLLQQVISADGWRAGYWFLAPVVLLMGALSFGLLSIGRKNVDRTAMPVAETAPTESDQIGLSFAQATKDLRFWILGASIVAASLANGVFVVHLQPLLADKGVPGATAALMASAYLAGVVAARFLTGAALDRCPPLVVGTIALSGPVIGLLLFLPASPALLTIGLGMALVAIAQGAEGDLVAFYAARMFGLKAFGKIFGVFAMALGVAVSGGAILGGVAYDQFGSYDLVLITGSILFGLSALLIFALRWFPATAEDALAALPDAPAAPA